MCNRVIVRSIQINIANANISKLKIIKFFTDILGFFIQLICE